MARKSRKNIASADEHPVIKVWRAALYIRLSVEYNGKRGDSLETQRQIMEDCLALCPDVEITEIYIDNGVSGQTFDRQGFQKMLAEKERPLVIQICGLILNYMYIFCLIYTGGGGVEFKV